MPVKTVEHIPLAKCRVLYLGSAVPLETAVGLEAVQQPLTERYPADKEGDVAGIDAWITVLSSGIHMQYVEDPSTLIWFPIQTLQVCTAVKCVVMVNGSTGEKTPKFVSLDNPASTSTHPPIFAAIMRRTKGIKVLECHSFLCKSNTAAMALVQSCRHAFQHKEGWVDGPPPAEVLQADLMDTPVGTMRGSVAGTVHLMAAEPHRRDVAPEFLNPPPPQGVFYTNNKKLVRNFNVFGQDPGGPRAIPPHAMRPMRMPYARFPPPPFLRGPPPHPRMMMFPPPRGPPPMPLPPPPPQIEEKMYFIPADAGPGGLPPGLPASYFDDWRENAGLPLGMFPDADPEMVNTVVQDVPMERRPSSADSYRHRPPERRHSSRERRRSSSYERPVNRRVGAPERRPPERRRQSPSPERRRQRKSDEHDGYPSYEESSSSGDLPRRRYRKHRQTRPRTPPADYVPRERNGYRSPERVSRREQFELNHSYEPERRRFPSAYDRRQAPENTANGTSRYYDDLQYIERRERARSQPPMTYVDENLSQRGQLISQPPFYADENLPQRRSTKKKDKSKKKDKKSRGKNKGPSNGEEQMNMNEMYSPDAFMRRGPRGSAGPWMDFHPGSDVRNGYNGPRDINARSDEVFASRQERSALDEFKYTDPYALNREFQNGNGPPRDRDDDSQIDYAMFDKPYSNLERTLGYYP